MGNVILLLFNMDAGIVSVISGGVACAGSATVPDANVLPRPVIVFQVTLFDYQTLLAYPQPDDLCNIVLLAGNRTINIPGVPGPLKHGDQFTLFGEGALEVQRAYSDVLTIVYRS